MSSCSGLGAGLCARALYQHKVNLTLVEIDPAVYDFAVAYFGVDEVRVGDVVLEDAVTWARRQDQPGRVRTCLKSRLAGMQLTLLRFPSSSITLCTTS